MCRGWNKLQISFRVCGYKLLLKKKWYDKPQYINLLFLLNDLLSNFLVIYVIFKKGVKIEKIFLFTNMQRVCHYYYYFFVIRQYVSLFHKNKSFSQNSIII